ncbi:hypothetical protein DDB_G0280671 [Dictyostelium discoideum AX4]|uniref:Uncharacterized protein n=1 Tax=Dictyostelium discoideum TaxID=44689 RepID=Q54V17_DICDI|nr:hypothetical protein DDB_G0280671 [Dictyostelium discoideum AX4]EAL67137.1 hypothetical protein DDB_G0280671 [Dictyostelium discoideum AX4]|eukprot:XP_641114.1 hypothetical protein DDB_G0280671 [Dictyostelium discoideum AX4]
MFKYILLFFFKYVKQQMENNKQVEEEGVENKEVTLPKGVPPTIYTKRKRVSKKDNTQPLKLERSGKKQPIIQPKKQTKINNK